MKSNKIFPTLVVATILSLLIVAIPANLAHAAYYYEDIYTSPSSGEIGDYVYIYGEYFDESTATESIYVDIYFSSDEAVPGDRIGSYQEVTTYKKVITAVWIDEYGEFSNKRFKVPPSLTVGDEDVHGGTYYIYATYYDSNRIVAAAEFTIIAGEIKLDIDKGPVGTEVYIDGTSFDSREDITIKYDGEDYDEGEIEGDTDTDSDGDFSCTIFIPESTAGEHTITVTGNESGIEAEAEFTVEPEISVNPISGAAGTEVTVSGTGFEKDDDVTIYFAGSKDIDTTIETSDNGSFSGTFIVPTRVRDTYKVKASDGTNRHSVDFTITAGASLSSTTGNIGTTLTVSGTGFIVSAIITIKYDDTQVATTTADASGAFSVTFDVPASQYGPHTITASDGTNVQQFTFTMESEPPPTPQPLLPEAGIKAKAETYFDWEDVDDPSGATYTFQIATDKDFTSIVLEKEGLTSSGYTITKEEELESTKKEAPYYWRVKAIDGAANESEWSPADSFYVGFQWPELKGWLLYLVMGVGAFLIGLLGFWLGRRTAYSSPYY